MTLAGLTITLMLLLLTPGPTNTLMLLAGAERGLLRSLRLIPVELAAYLAVIAPLAMLAEALAGQIGVLRPVVATLAGLWVLFLAWKMWHREEASARDGTVTAARLAVTTLLNPKGLVMGLVLLPAAGATGAAFAVLALCVVAVAGFWAFLGCCLPEAEDGEGFPPLVARVAAVWLAALSVIIVAGGFTA